jgi:uncharacterized protein (DUF1015 family)
MAILRPLRAIHYHSDKVPLSQVIAPPYDVISPEERDRLYESNPYNVVRLILGKDNPGDQDAENRYTRARYFLETWLREGVLVQDSKPGIYLYQQAFSHPVSGRSLVRRAFFTLLRLEPFESGVVFPHEKTYAKPKADRFRLLEETHTNLSPVFGLYRDENGEVKAILDVFYSGKPVWQASDPEGVRHDLWCLDDADAIAKLSRSFQSKKIVLADGHHRYETALNHWQAKGRPEESPCQYVLISLVDIADPGLVVLPTHRLLKRPNGFSPSGLLNALSEYFTVAKMPAEKLMPGLNTLTGEEKGFGVYLGKGEGYLAKLKSEQAIAALRPRERSAEWAALEVSILSYVVLEKILALGEQQFEEYLAYTRSDREAISRVDSGEFAASFLTRSIPVRQIQAVCERRDLMPHKSTYFYPKLASGLVFYRHS